MPTTAPELNNTAHPHLLERLMEVVRPEFRGEVFHPPRNSSVFYLGECEVPECTVMVSHTARGLCEGHYQRWKAHEHAHGETGFARWCQAEVDRVRSRQAPPAACGINDCNRGVKSHGLCHRHVEAWSRSSTATQNSWLGQAIYTAPRLGERDCEFEPACGRWTDGPARQFCHAHHGRWLTRGRPDPQVWFADLAHGRDPRVRLSRLNRHLRLEVQFGLQCRHDDPNRRTMIRTVVQAVTAIERASEQGLASVLDWEEDQWRAMFGTRRTARSSSASGALQFIRDTRVQLEVLLAGSDRWAAHYPRDTWDLRVLGIAHPNVRYYRFAAINQPWLQQLAKRWTRWRLTRSIDPSTQAINLRALISFSEYLDPGATIDALTRPLIESWLAKIGLDIADPSSRRAVITSLGTFLRDVHHHGWAPDLSPTAWVFNDTPPATPAKPRWIEESVMRQIEDEDRIACFPSDDGRLILQILINCGLRLKDARLLPFDCLIRDATAAPYLAWINHKMRGRPAFFPISEPLAAAINAQQQRTVQRFPAGSRYLFPAHQANLSGTRPVSDGYWRKHLDSWLADIHLTRNGKPHRVTAHQFRHTLGTRLLNQNVPQHVVQFLLDHMSPEMTAIYARFVNSTVREHWERATKLDGQGQPAALDPGHPLADAQWMRLSMNRAKVTLPNGYCGAPIQTDCEYANPCLGCRFFITTIEFLPQHKRQLEETRRLVATANQAGMKRIAQKNTQTLIKLETLIASLEQVGPQQILAGGQVEDLDAAL